MSCFNSKIFLDTFRRLILLQYFVQPHINYRILYLSPEYQETDRHESFRFAI